jgi:hypothetical protein
MTTIIEAVYLTDATQSAAPSDLDSNAWNPINRAGFFSSDKGAYPYSTTDVPATSGAQQWWRANTILKIGQSI